jgi:predicted RNase H-like HicB family nuclease
MIKQDIWRKAEELAAQKYTVVFYPDVDSTGKKIFIAKSPELYGCMAEGLTKEEAEDNLMDARVDYIYSLLIDNLTVPEPIRITESTAGSYRGAFHRESIIFEVISAGPTDRNSKTKNSKPLYVDSK